MLTEPGEWAQPYCVGASQVAGVSVGPLRQIVPHPDLPPEVELLASNNNLDAVVHEGRLYLAFRTGLTHFATPWTRLYVLASDTGGASWTHELTIERGRDLREPRLLSWGGKLFFYFFEAGANPLDFAPGRIFATERRPATSGRQDWTLRPRPARAGAQGTGARQFRRLLGDAKAHGPLAHRPGGS